jgi:FtsZ-binding cell division protein ZapB
MPDNVITNFQVSVYGKMEKFSDTISKGRCRVFYKGRNRNGTYITPEFAEKLIASAPYTPVKGIYDGDGEDYTDHGQKRSEGRIYGIVPADPNFAWEWHTDEDGVSREYACFDVLYYTALYKEAGQIHGKGESMELYRQTLKGDWKIVDGKKTYVFTDGCFLGLQALGDDVEPCFEGASFYTRENESNIIALLEKYEKRTDLFQYHEQGGNDTMPSINFKVSDCQKFDFLFNLLNPNFNEAGGWVIEYAICDVYDEYAIARNYSEGCFERIYYKKDDENDSLEITNRERCYIVDVNEAEKNALNNIKGESTYVEVEANIAASATTIENLNTTIGELNTTVETLNNTVTELNGQITTLNESNENLTTENSNYSTKVGELEDTISTLTTERDEARSNYDTASARLTEVEGNNSELTTTLATVTAERDTLAAYRKSVEDEAKKAVVNNYIEQLPEEVIESYMNNLDNYTIEDLDMRLTYEQKKANPVLFSKTPAPAPNAFVPKDDDGSRSINDILAKYEKH